LLSVATITTLRAALVSNLAAERDNQIVNELLYPVFARMSALCRETRAEILVPPPGCALMSKAPSTI
jgi:hypothetical protein